MKTWDIVLSIAPTGFPGRLDALADTLADCLNTELDVMDATISGDLDTGQLDVHFEFRGSEDAGTSVTDAIAALHRALARCNAIISGGMPEVAEPAQPVVGLVVQPAGVPSASH